ncbi:MAG: cupin-like domain-containing protein [Lacipirellulaceae bacterium]
MHASPLVDWSPLDFAALERGVLVARHALAETGLFTDDALAAVLDAHPAEHLSVNTMGKTKDRFDWREGDRNGVGGAELVRMVRDGHLWVNVRRVLDYHPDHAAAVHAAMDALRGGAAHFRAEQRTANLLLSSPGAWVPYHVDMPVNMLWHLRGRKRVWVYPHFDNRFATPLMLEKVCSGEWSEEVPYDPEFDRYALVFDAEPGEMISWPQLAPHRVENLEGLNVSLSTEHKNQRARRRINVHTGNHVLRKWGFPCRSIEVDGWGAHVKQFVARLDRYAGKLRGEHKQQWTYPKTFVLDPAAPDGFRSIESADGVRSSAHEGVAVGAV